MRDSWLPARETARRPWLPALGVVVIAAAGCAGALRSTAGPARVEPHTAPARSERAGEAPAQSEPLAEELPSHDSRSLPGGLACLIRLRVLEIPHRNLGALRGVDTPVRVTGPVGGIHYRPMGRHGLVADCRLVLALHRAAPYLRNLGVTEIHFSGAYSFRRMPGGRLSRHAMGLAIDVHRVLVGDDLLDVAEDYELQLEQGCAPEAPALNRIACLLSAWGVFDRVLTPDFDRAHYNHLHLAILSLHRRRHVPIDSPPRAMVR